ncbi:amino acid adenylation domain-containing protein [Aerosakkonema sp. BLCC-F2]
MDTGTAKFDLTLELDERPEGIIGRIEYSTDLFDASTISRLIGHFQALLEGVVANPNARISELPVLTEAERHQLLVEWNNTTTEYPFDKCIHQLFEEQVEHTPDAVAVVFEGKQLTYRELNAKANQLAHYLQTLGVKPEVLVGICVERSLEMLVGLLGILKAGGAYVPIDPAYPSERIAYILDDSQLSVLLTQKQLITSLPKHQTQVICLDSDWEEISTESDLPPITTVTPENLAYAIYTSGSTGKPKGVLIPHSGLLNLVFWHQRILEITSSDRTTQLAGTAFDASVWEMWPYLASGASIYLVKPDILLSPEKLRDWVVERKITITFVPTPIAEKLLSLQWPCDGALRIMLTGGDKLHQYPSASIPFNIVNNYGPTENTVVTTSGLVVCDRTDNSLPHIGRPIDNTQIYILDRYLQPVPIGVPGELHIASFGLARGYLNRPDLTQEKFIPNPFSNQPSDRLYKTGDLARYLPDGNIEFLGRIDNQVEIRGFRIELGEIEAVLSQHPDVRETVVIATENVAGNKQLVAYVVPHNKPEPAITDLRHFLKQQLPDYMVPSAFVVLEALPLTPNGKVDRRALPAPEKRSELEESFVAPRTPIEAILANIWENILSIDSVGVYGNFFELGGHSLLATQVISRVRDTLAIELPLRSLFEAPTIAEFAARVENLLKHGQSVQALPLVPIPRPEPIPLSFAQARLWFLDQLQPDSAFYNIPLALRLNGMLNIAALENSINEIIRRHEALRTNFTAVEGQPVQVIASTRNCQLQVVNLLHLPETDREIEAQQLALAEANRPFNLEREPLLRGTLLQLGETEYVLLLTMHHIISDGWSLGVFVKELTEFYTAFCCGKSPSLPELPIQYADFALWQRQWLTGERVEIELNYWQQQLLDAPALLELPTDRPRRSIQTFRGAHQSFTISQDLSFALVGYSKRTGVTLFMLLLAAFQTLLYRYTGQDDIVVGTPVGGRNQQEIEGLIGFFVNTLVLRADLSGNPTFEQLLNRIREVALGAYAHQNLPFEQLVEALHPTRDLSYTPLFQVMFAFDDASVPSFELPELRVSSYPVEIGTAKFDLTLSMENTASGLMGVWEYNTDLFDGATIARMTGHFQTLLEAIAINPQQKISELPLLTEAERHQLLVEWNNTGAEYPQDRCIHQLFEEQVERSPDAVAVVFEGKQLTYQELNTRANQLAHYLQALGVKPEVLVGICIERSLEMIVGLLGILKAGGAYVPIDPAYPSKRIAYMLDDSQLAVLLTQQKLVASLPKHQAQVICLDSDWGEIYKESELPTTSTATAENLAYVIYTSGSTGHPKGVEVVHRGVNRLLFGINYVHLDATQRFLQIAPISFDASTFEIWGALLHGATCVLFPGNIPTAKSLSHELYKHGITILWLTAALFNAIVNDDPQTLSAIKQLLIGGEALSVPHVRKALSTLPLSQIINGYGPTESTTFTCCYAIPKQLETTLESIPIGRPIANTQIYILDKHLQAVPAGVSGEIYIGGDGLARGYLNRPELTKEKFIASPFDNSKLYKTGDLARYLPDGNIEYLGRIDNQVKIRGFRIELGEIEAAIAQHPAIKETVVIARDFATDNKQLVAYIVPHQEKTPTINELRHFLKQQLPDYMIPNAFVVLETLPLTPNGKVDRKSLPLPDINSLIQKADFVAPGTPTEKLVASIWAEVLRVEKVGINDNFFELGGHSLLATKLIAQVKEIFLVEVPLSKFFEFPNVASLSSYIDAISWATKSWVTSKNTVKREEEEF